MGFPAQASALVGKELKVIVRDRQALILLFLMPAVFIFFLSFALKNVFSDKIEGAVPVVLESADGGALAASVAHRLRSRPELTFVARGGAAEDLASDSGSKTASVAMSKAAKDAVRKAANDADLFASGVAKAVVRIPDGFSKDLEVFIEAGGTGKMGPHRIVWTADPTLDASYRMFLKASIALAVQGAILEEVSDAEDGVEVVPDPQAFLSAASPGSETPFLPTPLQQTVPGWSLFAMFFIVVPLAGSVLREQREGTMRRLATYPVARSAIILGKLVPYVLVNVVQFAAMLAVGVFVVPALGNLSLQLGRTPWHLVPVTLACALAATGFGILVASLARTAEQASAFGATAIVIMAVVGGIMVPIFVMPAAMRTIALASPLYWGHQAYLDVLLRGADLSVLAPKLAALVVFAMGCFALASWRLRRVA